MEIVNKKKVREVTFNSDEELYKSIDKNGSLGLLALGAKGLLLWRKKREELSETKIENTDTND